MPDRIRPLTLETFPARLAPAEQRAGFVFERHVGKHRTVKRRTVGPAAGA